MDTTFNFTMERLTSLKCPSDKDRIRYHDAKVDGLSIRVTAAGGKAYMYYRRLPDDNETPRKLCEITIGGFGDITLEHARKQAQEFNIAVGDGRNPALKPTEGLTYGTIFARYIYEYAKTRTTTWQNTIYNHERYFKRWHEKAISGINRQGIQRWVNDVGEDFGKYTANRNYNIMRAVFSWALRKEILTGDNPCAGVDVFKTKARERFIQPGKEFEAFAEALNKEPNDTIRDFFWMCLFTGARRANVLAMEWSQIEFGRQVWRIPITKNQESLTVPLTLAAMEILNRRRHSDKKHEEWVFPSDRTGKKTGVLGHMTSPGKAWGRIIERAKIEDLRIHDLRRTAGSYMAIEGISPTIIGKALGHKSPQSTAIYARLTQDPVRAALEKAQQALTKQDKTTTEEPKIAKIEKPKVVKIKRTN